MAGRTHPLVDVAVLELNEPSADGGDIALLVAERHAAGSLRVLQFRIGIDSRVTHPAVQSVHDHGQFDCKHKKRRGRRERRNNHRERQIPSRGDGEGRGGEGRRRERRQLNIIIARIRNANDLKRGNYPPGALART